MQPPGRQLMVRLSASTGDAVVMVTLSLHILAAGWTGISLQNRKSRCSVTLMHVWHVRAWDWHVGTSAQTFRFCLPTILCSPFWMKLQEAKHRMLLQSPAGCVVSHMIRKTLEHTIAITNSAAVTTVNVSMSTKSTLNWVCVRLQVTCTLIHKNLTENNTDTFVAFQFTSFIWQI